MKRLAGSICLVLALASVSRAQPQVFLVTELSLRDPHAFASLPLFGCSDVTDTVLGGLLPSVNEQIADALTMDGDLDGFLDLSPIIVSLGEQEDIATGTGPAIPELQWNPDSPGGELAFHFAACTAPQSLSACGQDLSMPVQYSLYANAVSGTCLAPLAGTTGSYSPPIILPQAPCMVSDPFRMTMDVAGLHLELDEARVGATYVGNPPVQLIDGLILGFLPEAAADTVLISTTVPIVGGQPVSSILPGGTGCCSSSDDRDVGPDGLTMGWWLSFNFTALPAAFTATGAPEPAAGAANGLRLSRGKPNPFRQRTTLSYTVPSSGPVRIRVLDVAGRTVNDLVRAGRPAGTYSTTWNGVDRTGSPVAPGIYFIRLEFADGARTRRVVRLR